jgi:hypothetical protein
MNWNQALLTLKWNAELPKMAQNQEHDDIRTGQRCSIYST